MTAMTDPAAQILVDTFREGMLSVLGHDLRLEAQRFELRVAQGELTGHVELSSLHVLGSMRRGQLDESAPSASERAEIEQRICEEILVVSHNPRASVTGSVRPLGKDWSVSGTLVLHGRAQPLGARVTRVGDALETSVQLAPSHFGIAPFSALGGALRIADRVTVRLRLPLAAATSGGDLLAERCGRVRFMRQDSTPRPPCAGPGCSARS